MNGTRPRARPAALALPAAALVLVAALATGEARADGLGDWLRTPGERAAAALDSEGRRRLIDAAPDSEWAAHARYRDGEIDAALAGFEARLARETDAGERRRLRYNRATALVRAGRPDEAIEAFDELLDERPDDVEAAANRDVARRLAELIRSSEAPAPSGGDGRDEPNEGAEEGDDGNGRSGDGPGRAGGSSGERPEDGPDGRSGEASAGAGGTRQDPDDVTGDGSPPPGADGRDAAGSDPGPADGDGPDAAAADLDAGEAASAAGPRAPGEPTGVEDGRDGGYGEGEGDTPLGEREQAVEQWLSRIPDDPSGLLRRKLLQSHRRDWPDVVEGGGGW